MQRLLFITPKIHEQDDDFAFTSLWAKAFVHAGFAVTVICYEKGEHTLPFPVYSLGHECGWSRLRSFFEFQKLILTIPHDRVFVHMNPRWLAAGAWYWFLKRTPVYLWYTHYTQPLSLKIGAPILRRMFAATVDCLPQYNDDARKIVTGHGIDTSFWETDPVSESDRESATHLLAVHRISKSKRLDIVLRALMLLPKEYTLTHYGRSLDPRSDPEYQSEIEKLASDPRLLGRVRFMGSVPMPALRNIFPKYRVIVNMVPQTIDKSVLEGMYCGLTPVVTPGHAAAIDGISSPKDDSPEAVAEYIQHLELMSREDLQKIVREQHGLDRLVEKMSVFIRKGN